MSTLMNIKDFRKSLADVADAVENGQTFVVMRRSKPSFVIKPFEGTEVKWKTLIDFTEDSKDGIPADKLLSAMKKFEKQYG